MLKTLSSLKRSDLMGKKVLLRGDLDVASGANGEVTEDYRLQKMLPTLKFLQSAGVAQVIIIGHRGRPDGQVKSELRLDVVCQRLSELLGESIKKLDDCLYDSLPADPILMLENLRFYPQEEKNDENFAKKLASYADLYVNDCFSTSHRAHASTASVTKFLPSYAGLQLEKEVEVLSSVLKNPERPLVVIIGGAKLETKEPVIHRFMTIADSILVGGKIIIGPPLVGGLDLNGVRTATGAVPTDYVDGKDIGPATIKQFVDIIKTAKTIVWNGPVGMFEDNKYEKGTQEVAQAVASSTAKTIVGGGDTVAALQKYGLTDKIGFVSTGGGAMLDFLAGQTLPGIVVLETSS